MAGGFGTGSKQSRHLRRMLDERVNSDARIVIVARDGGEIKCHRFILTDESDVFEAMFKETSKSKELATGTIQMEDMCSTSVEAFLAFLYLDDIRNAQENSAVALDLFKAGHKYHILSMEEQMRKILLEKPDKWFNLEVTLQLYFHAKNLENGDTLKKRSLDVMKSNYATLNESPDYIQLFEKEPKAARELCADLMFPQACDGVVSNDQYEPVGCDPAGQPNCKFVPRNRYRRGFGLRKRR